MYVLASAMGSLGGPYIAFFTKPPSREKIPGFAGGLGDKRTHIFMLIVGNLGEHTMVKADCGLLVDALETPVAKVLGFDRTAPTGCPINTNKQSRSFEAWDDRIMTPCFRTKNEVEMPECLDMA